MRERPEPRPLFALVALSFAVVVASAPAWTGSFIYDDFRMRGNAAMDGFEDLVLAFGRTSADYLEQTADESMTGVTYRPLSHLTLIGVQAAGGGPLAHHLVSLLLHLACALALYAAVARRARPELALALAMAFSLHPLALEAYGWINGRSDVLAGLALAALAFLLARRERGATPLLVGACACGATLAKETALVAVLALLSAEALPSRGGPSRAHLRERAPLLAAGALGLALAVAIRALTVGLARAGAAALEAEAALGVKLARLFGEALRSMLVPAPRTMATLAWELAHPLGAAELALLAVAAGAAAWLLVRRRFRAAALLAGAFATLAPTVVVSSSFWSGFDRYLYMPAILACLAVAASPMAEGPARLPPRTRRLAVGLVGLVLFVGSFRTAQAYASQADFMASMVHFRPDDPSGYLFGAEWMEKSGDVDAAARLLDSVPKRGLPRPLASALITRLARVGQVDEALGVLDDMVARHPDDPYALYDLVAASLDRGALDRALSAADRLRGRAGFCRGVGALLEQAEARAAGDGAARLAAFRAGYGCE